jgi:hypothetical protein
LLLATSAVPVRGTRHQWLVPASRWAAPLLFAPTAWLLFGPAAFPRGATAAAMALIEPLPDSNYARLGLELGMYSNRSGALRLEYRGAEPVLYPHRQTQRQGKVEDWVFGEGPRPFVETLDRRRYVLHVLEGDDVIAFHLEASVYDETAGPRLVVNNASGRTLENLWLVFDGYGYELGSMAAGARVERRFTRGTHGIEVGKTPWRHVIKPPAGVPAQMPEPAQIVLERRAQAMGKRLPRPRPCPVDRLYGEPFSRLARAPAWPRQQRALVAFRVAAIAEHCFGDRTRTEPMERAMPNLRTLNRPGCAGSRSCRNKEERMMRSNPLVTEVLVGLTRQGNAQLDALGLLLLQAVVLFLWWPKDGLAQMLESQHGPHTLTAVVIAMGVTTAYFALRAGAEEVVMPGQHGLRDWALATPLGLGRILRGYVMGQLIHSLHLLALSTPLVLMAFTVSGGEWDALGWCVAAMLVQALFYRLCGAITHVTIGQHRVETGFFVRAILVVVYVPVGLLAPVTSHVAFTSRTLGEHMNTQPAFPAVPDQVVFLAAYAGCSLLAALLHRLLLRERRRMDRLDGAGVSEAVTP